MLTIPIPPPRQLKQPPRAVLWFQYLKKHYYNLTIFPQQYVSLQKTILYLKFAIMIKIDHIKKFPFAEKYLFNTNGLNLTSFSKRIQKRVLNEVTIDDLKFIDKIYQWKELIIQGNDLPCPIDEINFSPREIKQSKLSVIWKIADYVCALAYLPILIIIGFFIWGNLDIEQDYHILIITAIIVVLVLLTRLAIHIKLIRNIKILEQLFPFVAVNRKIESKSAAKELYSSLIDTSYDKYSEYFHPNISYYIRLNTYIAVYYDLIQNAISLYPDKILLYYKYGQNNSAVYEYKEEKKQYFLFQYYTEKTRYGYKNIFNILKDIDKKENRVFLSSIISSSKVENIRISQLDEVLERNFTLCKDYLLVEGEYKFNEYSANKWQKKQIYKTEEAYKFSSDKFFKTYVIILSVLSIILFGFYPVNFRYDFVQKKLTENKYQLLLEEYETKCKLAENKYQLLLEEYEAKCKLLYDLDSVNLVISVCNNMEYNNHVGDSWGYNNSINNVRINGNKTIIPYCYGKPIHIQTEIVEYDNWDDVSSRVDEIICSKEELIEGVVIPIDSYVYENRGKYSGCHAKWTSHYYIEVEKPNKPIYQNIEAEKPIYQNIEAEKPIYQNIKIPASEVILNFFKSF